MSEFNQSANLGPFEARLAELLPCATEVDRDEVLFEAGRQSAQLQHRRALHKWHAACGVLTCFVVGQWILLPSFQPLGETTPIADVTPEEQSPAVIPTVSDHPVIVQDKRLPLESDKTHSPVQVPEEIVAIPKPEPSVWGQIFTTGSSSLAMQRQLSIGSSRKGALPMPTLAPPSGSLPSHLDATLTSMRRDWSAVELTKQQP
ncbi:hypothetical protein [Blastopirellula marina]|uniref:Uncharacterized protein n=1 Tax=Blastopirellula marina TaxID=124 RepID=A0A2S8G8D3_9BACT|nr:hypothetical protein [Blastopirellula marina]PQO40715.1 hypothetical protein C5Y98_05715 [Blastopirellula marina]PTL45675.1 hypothetical protein C5Y97_05715 [Blastopirellula marina]